MWVEKPMSSTAAPGARILVVDDEEDIVELLTRNLRRAGYDVRTASDGLAAWEAFEKDPVDLVITDLKMPRLDGEQFAKRIKERAPLTPVVVLTGHGTQLDIERL